MKALLLTTEKHADKYSEFYTGLHKQIGSMDMRRLNENEQINLKNYFSNNTETSQLDRIIFHLDFKTLKTQIRFLKGMSNLVFFNTDTLCGREKNSCCGITQQIKFFKKIPWAKIIVTNFRSMQLFQDAGLDAWCVPKGFNSLNFTNSGTTRNIELAFVETSSSHESEEVLLFKQSLMKNFPKTNIVSNAVPIEMRKLDDVKIAICADIGRREYSAKVFQAMASGCLTMSYDQGNEDTFSLSLKDMENIVLFDSFEVLSQRINYFRKRPEKIIEISQNGYALAREQHQESTLGRQAGRYIVSGVRDRVDYGVGITAFGLRF